MSRKRLSGTLGLLVHVFAGIVVIVGATYAGFWLGGSSSSFSGSTLSDNAARSEGGAIEIEPAKAENPRRFYAYFAWDRRTPTQAVMEEARLAAAIGVTDFIIATDLPWPGHLPEYADAAEPLHRIAALAPGMRIVLDLRVAPPPEWYNRHPEALVNTAVNGRPLPSLASDAWRQGVAEALHGLAANLKSDAIGAQIDGVVLRLAPGQVWGESVIFDRSSANEEAYRNWLRGQFPDTAEMRRVLGGDIDSGEGAAPATESKVDGDAVFVDPTRSLYAAYVADTTSDTLLFLASTVKSALASKVSVFAPYGQTFELRDPASGQFALGKLLASDQIDGIVVPVSSGDRGVGGAGGFAAPVSSVRIHNKACILIDDTRTGLELETPESGETVTYGRAGDPVYHVQRRNFAAAMTNGLSYAVADPTGSGALLDTAMWQHFGRMRDAMNAEVEFVELPGMPFGPPPTEQTPLVVVVDESSQGLLYANTPVRSLLLQHARDCAIRSGLPARFNLLSDVAQGRTPPAKVYLFLNAFELTPSERIQLHRVLERDNATAIWMYAPGYFGGENPADNISLTVGMRVVQFDGEAKAGSRCDIDSPWIAKDAPIGRDLPIAPLFYIDDIEASTIATYRESGKVSAAIRFFGDEKPEWTSVYLAEPSLTPGLLREILQIAELHLYLETSDPPLDQALYFGPGLLAIHAREAGDRVLDLGVHCSIQDILNPERGWARRRYLTLPMIAGETTVLRLAASPDVGGT